MTITSTRTDMSAGRGHRRIDRTADADLIRRAEALGLHVPDRLERRRLAYLIEREQQRRLAARARILAAAQKEAAP